MISDAADEIVDYVKNLLSGYEIESQITANIYEAVGQLAKSDTRNIFVVGRFEQLNKEKGRFFQKLAEKNINCCCVAPRQLTAEQLAAAKEAHASIVNELKEIETVFTLYLESGTVGREVPNQISDEFNAGDFAATKAEIDALLGND